MGLAIIVGFWLLRKTRRDKKYKLPPRVPGVPIFGNTFQIPALQQGPWAKGLAEKYGEMFVLYAVVPTLQMLNFGNTGSLASSVALRGYF